MSHNRGLHLGFGLGTNILAGESGFDPSRFARDEIAVTDSILQIVTKTQRDSIAITERTLAGITELVLADSLDVSEGTILGQRIASRGDMDTLAVSDNIVVI